MNVLLIQSSILGQQSVSRQLAEYAVSFLTRQYQALKLDVLDLANEQIPHIDEEYVQATLLDEEKRTAAQQLHVQRSDQLIARFKAADIVVIGAPLYNATIPTKLASTFDYIARAGVTFRYTEQGVEGLLGDRKVIVVSSRGGFHKDNPHETQTQYITNFFKELGVTSLEFIYAEGTGISDEIRTQAIESARQQIENIRLLDHYSPVQNEVPR